MACLFTHMWMCVCAYACSHRLLRGMLTTHKHTGTRRHFHANWKEKGWQKSMAGPGRKRLPQKRESSCGILPQKSPGLNTQWEWDVGWGEGGSMCVTMRERERGNEKEIHTKWPNSLSCAGFPALALPHQKRQHHTCRRTVTPLQLPEQHSSQPVPVTRYLFPLTSGSNCLLNALWSNKCRVTYMMPVPKAQCYYHVTLTSCDTTGIAPTLALSAICGHIQQWAANNEYWDWGSCQRRVVGTWGSCAKFKHLGFGWNDTWLLEFVWARVKHILICSHWLRPHIHVWFCTYQDLTSSRKHENEQLSSSS